MASNNFLGLIFRNLLKLSETAPDAVKTFASDIITNATITDGTDGADTILLTSPVLDLTIFGNAGNDFIDGTNAGEYVGRSLTYLGGLGNDTFKIASYVTPSADNILTNIGGISSGVIGDFETGDKIDLSNYTNITSFDDLAMDRISGGITEYTALKITSAKDSALGLQVSIADSFDILGTSASLSASDFIFAAAEAIGIDGSSADDILNGTAGDDAKVRGLDGNDTVDGGLGNDFVNGNAGSDSVSGGDGNDRVLGGKDNDTVDGGAGDDTVNGNLGDDSVRGGDGNDDVRGGQGNDIVFGETGDDTLKGNKGDDTLTGGDGADLFHFVGTDLGNDVITDWNVEQDNLGFSSEIFETSVAAVAAMSVSGADVVIDMGNGSSVTLTGFGSVTTPIETLLSHIDII
jgi:Ca2+-binding RTX toxin-like protein